MYKPFEKYKNMPRKCNIWLDFKWQPKTAESNGFLGFTNAWGQISEERTWRHLTSIIS